MHYNIIETGKRIKELRRKRGLTQKKLAEMIGMAPNSIAKIENGVVGASIDALLIMCQILNTDLDYLICGKKHKEIELIHLIEDIPKEKQVLAIKILKGILENL